MQLGGGNRANRDSHLEEGNRQFIKIEVKCDFVKY